MKYLLHSFVFLLAIIIFTPLLYSTNGQANADEIDWRIELFDEQGNIRNEYAYYRVKFDDDGLFPPARKQVLLTHIEETYLKQHDYQVLASFSNPMEAVPTTAFAKLFLGYGGVLWTEIRGDEIQMPLLYAVSQKERKSADLADLSHPEIIELIKKDENSWGWELSSNNSIAVAKLFLSLGNDVHQILRSNFGDDRNALRESLHVYHRSEGQPNEASPYNEIHRADDIIPADTEYSQSGYDTYYRSPVTYWIEEFISAGYPAAMLDTHPLLYPRFVAEADVEDVADMLNNPTAHKISANINCRYKGAEAEAYNKPDESICPLTPSINMQDAMGRTPLHIAGETGNQAVYDYLISQSADTSIQDFRGNLPSIR